MGARIVCTGSRESKPALWRPVAGVLATSPMAAGAPGTGRSSTAKAGEAIEAAQRLGEDLTGVPADEGRISHKDLDELAELHRQNAIRERLAKHRAALKSQN